MQGFSDFKSVLEHEKVDEIIKYLMEQYAAQSIENARDLHQHANHLVDVIIEKTAKRNQELYQAGSLLIFQRSMAENAVKHDPGVVFSTMIPVCKAMFPKGTVDGHSEADKRYFRQFLDLFHNKKAFNWKKDKRWADTMGYTEYLQLVEQKEKEAADNGT